MWYKTSLIQSYTQALFSSQNFSRFSVTSNLRAHAWSIKYTWKQKLFAQFICKPRDKSFEPSYSIIGQCLSNKNESAIVPFFTGFYQLNKASEISSLEMALGSHPHLAARDSNNYSYTASAMPSLSVVAGPPDPGRRPSSVLRPCLVPEKFCKIFQISRGIESLDACMEY
jgi:hypothetical protein